MKKTILIFLYFALLNHCVAQVKTYEMTMLLPLDAVNLDSTDHLTQADSYLVRRVFTYQLNTQLNEGIEPFPLWDECHRLAKAKTLDTYSDSTFQRKTPPIWSRRDTHACTFDPRNPTSETGLIEIDFDFERFKGYKVLHRFYFDIKTNNLTCEIPAFAPVMAIYNDKIELRQLPWIKNKLGKSRKPKLVWSKYVNFRIADSQIRPLNDTIRLKNRVFDAAKNGKLPLFRTEDGGWTTPMKRDEVAWERHDTLIHNLSADGSYGVFHDTVKVEQCKVFTFKMSYFLEEKPFRLSCKIERYSIYKDVLDDRGNWRYWQPLLYLFRRLLSVRKFEKKS